MNLKDKNVLFIMTDQWRVDSLGYSGNPIVKTPNIDKLAAKGHILTNAHTVTPLCSPARGCLLSGLLPQKNGVLDNLLVGASTQAPLGDDMMTWLTEGPKNGFNTAYFGKWHLGRWTPDKFNVTFDMCREEFDDLRKNKSGMATSRGEVVPGAIESQKKDWNKGIKSVSNFLPFYGYADDEKEIYDYKIAKRTVEFLDDCDENQKWFVTASFRAPHFPLAIPEPYYSMYDPKDMPIPESITDRYFNKPWFQNRHWWPTMRTEVLTDEDWQKTIAAYYGMISYVDKLIGDVIEAAKKKSGGRETVVVFSSDHGEMLGNHSRFDKGAYFYEDVVRIPLVICDDLNNDSLKSDTVKEYCDTQDIAKTIYSAINSEGQGNGRDLLKLVEGTSTDEWKDECYGVYHKYNGHIFEVRSISTPRYKYSYVPQDVDELYDLEKDPHEMTNLSDYGEYAEIKKELKAKVFEFMRKNDDYLLEEGYEIVPAGSFDSDPNYKGR